MGPIVHGRGVRAFVPLLLVLSSCMARLPPEAERGAPAAQEAPASSPSASPTDPPLKVENNGLGASKRLIRLAIAELKRIDYWEQLTRDFYYLRFGTRPDPVQNDDRISDIVAGGLVDESGSGASCDIYFYEGPMKQEYREKKSRGLGWLSLRHFWTSWLAHEIARCRGTGDRDSSADRWQLRTLRKLAKSTIT